MLTISHHQCGFFFFEDSSIVLFSSPEPTFPRPRMSAALSYGGFPLRPPLRFQLGVCPQPARLAEIESLRSTWVTLFLEIGVTPFFLVFWPH